MTLPRAGSSPRLLRELPRWGASSTMVVSPLFESSSGRDRDRELLTPPCSSLLEVGSRRPSSSLISMNVRRRRCLVEARRASRFRADLVARVGGAAPVGHLSITVCVAARLRALLGNASPQSSRGQPPPPRGGSKAHRQHRHAELGLAGQAVGQAVLGRPDV